MARTCSGLSRSAPGTPFSLSPYSAPVAPWKTGPVWLARLTVICCAAGGPAPGAALAGARTNGVVTAVAVANDGGHCRPGLVHDHGSLHWGVYAGVSAHHLSGGGWPADGCIRRRAHPCRRVSAGSGPAVAGPGTGVSPRSPGHRLLAGRPR